MLRLDEPAPDGPSDHVIRELHRDRVRQQRRKFLLASPLLMLAAFAFAAGVMAPRQFGGLVVIAVLIAFGVGQVGWEWIRLQRAEPVALYRREQREAEQQRADLTAHLLRSADVRTIATLALTVTIGLVTLVQFVTTDIRQAVAIGGLVKPAVRAGEWWRLLTATYLHGNLMHVAFNLSALVTFGRLIEVYERRMHVPFVYLASAIGGSVLSTALTSIGASGGVLGLAGYVVTVAGRQPEGTPEWIRRSVLSMLASTAVMGIAAFMFIDNAAHAGGAATGAAIGYLSAGPPGRSSTASAQTAGGIAALVLAAGAIFTIGRLILAW
jgi:membrane associated rhomboid family serine protease